MKESNYTVHVNDETGLYAISLHGKLLRIDGMIFQSNISRFVSGFLQNKFTVEEALVQDAVFCVDRELFKFDSAQELEHYFAEYLV